MPNSKRTIYKPKKGRNISQKKLYKLPSKRHGQKGGGFFDSLTSILKGGEVPGSPKVDGDGNIVDVDDDTTSEQKEEETPDDEEEKKEEESETPVVEEDKTEEKNDETETPVDDEEKEKGILKGLGETMGRSLSDATSEVQGYMTQPASENESSADVDSADVDSADDDNSLMESPNVNIQVPCDELLAENKQLREKIDQLQEEIKELLKNQLNKLESNGSDFSQNSTNEITPNMGENSDTYDINPIPPEQGPRDEFGEASEEGTGDEFGEASEEGSGDEFTGTSETMDPMASEKEEGTGDDFSRVTENDESNNVEGNTGGTKRHRKKNRKTKRKRNKHVSFQK